MMGFHIYPMLLQIADPNYTPVNGMPFSPQPKPRLSATSRACRAVVAARMQHPGSECFVIVKRRQQSGFTVGQDGPHALRRRTNSRSRGVFFHAVTGQRANELESSSS